MSRGFLRHRRSGPLGLAAQNFHLSLGGDGSVCLGSGTPAGLGKQCPPDSAALQPAAWVADGIRNAVQAPETGLEGIVYEVWSKLYASQRPRMHEPPSVQELAQSLADCLGHEAGARIVLRTSRNCPQGSCFARVAHSFILVEREGHPPYIVDPSFQAQFHLGRNDDTYCSFLSTVPPLFVGTSDALEELVNLCAAAMSAAFSRQNMPTPPWRQGPVMLCRWRPLRYTDVPFTPRTATPPSPSPFASSAQQQQQQQEPCAASPAAPLLGTTCSSHAEPHTQLLSTRSSKLMPRQSFTLKRMSSKQTDHSAPPSHAIIIGFNPPTPLSHPAARPPHPCTPPGATCPSQLPHQRRCGSPHASRHGQQPRTLLAGCQPPTAVRSSKGNAGGAVLPAAKPMADTPGEDAAAAGSGAGRECSHGPAHSNSGTHRAAASGAAPAAAAQPQPPAVGAAHARPAFLNTQAGAIVNVYPCSEPASLVQPDAGLLATQSLSHTASGLLDEAAQQQEEQQELARKDSQQQRQREQVEAQKQQQQQLQKELQALRVEAGAYTFGKEAGQGGQQLPQPPPQKAAPKRGCFDLLPPVYKVRLGNN